MPAFRRTSVSALFLQEHTPIILEPFIHHKKFVKKMSETLHFFFEQLASYSKPFIHIRPYICQMFFFNMTVEQFLAGRSQVFTVFSHYLPFGSNPDIDELQMLFHEHGSSTLGDYLLYSHRFADQRTAQLRNPCAFKGFRTYWR